MNGRGWMLAMLATLLVASPSWADSNPTRLLGPGDSVMLLEDLIASGACCPFGDGFAETMGKQTGRWLLSWAGGNPSNVDPNPTMIHARLKLERRDAEGNWKTISRPEIMALAGRDASIEIGQSGGKRLLVKLNMDRVSVPDAQPLPASSPSPLLARMEIDEWDANGLRTRLAAPHVITLPNRDVKVSVARDDGQAFAIHVRMEEVEPTVRATGAIRPDPSSDVALRQPSALTTAAPPAPPAPVQLAAHDAPVLPPATYALRTKATPPPPADSLSPWISTSSFKAAPPLAPHPAPFIEVPRDLPPALEDPYFARKTLYEEHYQQKLQRLLAHIPGLMVAVDVELDTHVRQSLRRHAQNGHEGAVSLLEESSPLALRRVMAAITFPDVYIENLWNAQRIDDQPPTADALVALMDEVKSEITELSEAVLPNQDGFDSQVIIRSYTALESSNAQVQLAQQPLLVRPAPPRPFEVAPWMLGVIAITLLCASIGAAVLFRRAPPSSPVEDSSESAPRPPRRRAA